MKAIIHAINDDNVPGLQHLLGSLSSYDVNQPNKVWLPSARGTGLLFHRLWPQPYLANRSSILWERPFCLRWFELQIRTFCIEHLPSHPSCSYTLEIPAFLFPLQIAALSLGINWKGGTSCPSGSFFPFCPHATALCPWRSREGWGHSRLRTSSQNWNTVYFLSVFQHGTPPLLIAAGCGNIQMLQLLIKRGSRIDVQDKVIMLYH